MNKKTIDLAREAFTKSVSKELSESVYADNKLQKEIIHMTPAQYSKKQMWRKDQRFRKILTHMDWLWCDHITFKGCSKCSGYARELMLTFHKIAQKSSRHKKLKDFAYKSKHDLQSEASANDKMASKIMDLEDEMEELQVQYQDEMCERMVAQDLNKESSDNLERANKIIDAIIK